jgi:hypothetical protein
MARAVELAQLAAMQNQAEAIRQKSADRTHAQPTELEILDPRWRQRLLERRAGTAPPCEQKPRVRTH